MEPIENNNSTKSSTTPTENNIEQPEFNTLPPVESATIPTATVAENQVPVNNDNNFVPVQNPSAFSAEPNSSIIKKFTRFGLAISIFILVIFLGFGALFLTNKDIFSKKSNLDNLKSWTDDLSLDNVEGKAARIYLVVRLGDIKEGTVSSKYVEKTNYYDDKGVYYLAALLNDGSEGVEAFKTDKGFAALQYDVITGKVNTSFSTTDKSNKFVTPDQKTLDNLQFILDNFKEEIKAKGMKNTEKKANDLEWYTTQHSASMPADLFSIGKNISVKRPDGWTQTTIHFDDGTRNLNNYGLSMITDEDNKLVGIVFAPSLTKNSGVR